MFSAANVAEQARINGEDELSTVIYQAIGAGSTCWETVEHAGVFDSTQARDIAASVVEWLNNREDPNAPSLAEQRRSLAIQVAAQRCDDYKDIVNFAKEVEEYLVNGIELNSVPNSLDSAL